MSPVENAGDGRTPVPMEIFGRGVTDKPGRRFFSARAICCSRVRHGAIVGKTGFKVNEFRFVLVLVCESEGLFCDLLALWVCCETL